MAGSQKNRPVDPDIEDMRTFAEKHAGPTEPKKADLSGPSVGIEDPVAAVNEEKTRKVQYGSESSKTSNMRALYKNSAVYGEVANLNYVMEIDGIPVTQLTDEQLYRGIKELVRFMSTPLKLHDPKPLEEPDPDQYTPEMQQTDFAHQCLDYVLKRDMPEAVVNVDKIMGRGNSTVRIIGEF